MKAKLKGKKLIIELPLQAPKRSTSGKTMVVASSHGVRRSDLKVDGKTVCLSVHAFCYLEEPEDIEVERSSSRQRRPVR
jgi:hypothetical protein